MNENDMVIVSENNENKVVVVNEKNENAAVVIASEKRRYTKIFFMLITFYQMKFFTFVVPLLALLGNNTISTVSCLFSSYLKWNGHSSTLLEQSESSILASESFRQEVQR